MADDIDAMLQEEDQSSVSPAENIGQQNDSQGQSEEEVEFNNLSGSSQDRVRELVRRAKDAEAKLGYQPYVPPAPNTLAPNQRQALETLSSAGVATDEKVDTKIGQAENRILWNMEQTRLAQKYSGSNGEPQYVREEVEDYIRNHPQFMGYAPEDVFKFKMFPDEFSMATPQKTRSSSLRPTKSQGMSSSAITPDNVEEMVKAHDQTWYNEHQDEINVAAAAHTRQFDNQGNRI